MIFDLAIFDTLIFPQLREFEDELEYDWQERETSQGGIRFSQSPFLVRPAIAFVLQSFSSSSSFRCRLR
jgi:hypothetical protein